MVQNVTWTSNSVAVLRSSASATGVAAGSISIAAVAPLLPTAATASSSGGGGGGGGGTSDGDSSSSSSSSQQRTVAVLLVNSASVDVSIRVALHGQAVDARQLPPTARLVQLGSPELTADNPPADPLRHVPVSAQVAIGSDGTATVVLPANSFSTLELALQQ